MEEIEDIILNEIREYILWAATLKGHGWARRLPDYWAAGALSFLGRRGGRTDCL